MAVHRISKGLDLPLAGAPEPRIDDGAAVTTVALLGADTVGLGPSLAVQPGDRVLRNARDSSSASSQAHSGASSSE